MSFLSTIAVGIVLLGGLVFFHELGHFLAAKAFNVKVLKFSLGFGPRVWGFRRGETEYQLAALPLGGFVRMAGEDPSQPLEAADRGRGFGEQAPYKRAIIAFAGPAVNLLLPVAVFFAINLTEQQAPPALVGVVLPGEPGEAAGLLPGDVVLSVDGVRTRSFDEMRQAVEERGNRTIPLVVQRGDEQVTLTVRPTSELEDNLIEVQRKGRIGVVAGKFPSYVGVVPGSRAWEAGVRTFDRVVRVNGQPVSTGVELKRALEGAGDGALELTVVRAKPVEVPGAAVSTAEPLTFPVPAGEAPVGLTSPDLFVREVRQGTPAWEAGLRPLDRIVAVDGAAVSSGPRLERVFEQRWRDKKWNLPLTVERGGERVEIEFTPKRVEKSDPYLGSIQTTEYGFAFHPGLYRALPFDDDELVTVSYPPVEALTRAVDQTVEVTRGMTLAIAGLFTGNISARSIGSPIMMFQLAGSSAEQGLASFLSLFALISINLGLVNLLPIPVLDGFHILISGIEGISRRPVPARAREIASYVGIAFLLGLMLLAFTNDVLRLMNG